MNDTPGNPDTPSTAELDALRAIVEGTAGHTGDEFFRSLVRHLAEAVGARYAFVAVFAGGTRARILALWFQDRSPQELSAAKKNCHTPVGFALQLFDAGRPARYIRTKIPPGVRL